MHRRLLIIILLVPVMLLTISGCATAGSKPISAPQTAPPVEVTTPRGGWEAEWEKSLKEVKKEGRVVVATGIAPPVRQDLGNNFEKKYGITVEWIAGPWGTLPVKILSERRDIFGPLLK